MKQTLPATYISLLSTSHWVKPTRTHVVAYSKFTDISWMAIIIWKHPQDPLKPGSRFIIYAHSMTMTLFVGAQRSSLRLIVPLWSKFNMNLPPVNYPRTTTAGRSLLLQVLRARSSLFRAIKTTLLRYMYAVFLDSETSTISFKTDPMNYTSQIRNRKSRRLTRRTSQGGCQII